MLSQRCCQAAQPVSINGIANTWHLPCIFNFFSTWLPRTILLVDFHQESLTLVGTQHQISTRMVDNASQRLQWYLKNIYFFLGSAYSMPISRPPQNPQPGQRPGGSMPFFEDINQVQNQVCLKTVIYLRSVHHLAWLLTGERDFQHSFC